MKAGVNINAITGHSDAEFQAYTELRAKYDSNEMDGEEFYALLFSDGYEAICELNNFDLNGWGKIRPLQCMKNEDGFISDAGELRDRNSLVDLFTINNILMGIGNWFDQIDGVSWS